MKTAGTLFILITTLVFSTAAVQAQDIGELTVQDLIRKVETQYTGDTSYSKIRMKIVTDVWSRELTMESWSEGRDKFLASILEPKKEQGTATLKIGDEMWNYLPKIDRLMKIPSGLMGDSWMGSHLTNDDLVKENKIDELYTFDIESRDETTATIKCTPKPDAAIVWDKVIYKVDIKRLIPISIDYYDEDNELVRTMTFDNVENISGRWVPLKMVIRPIDEPDEMTELIYESLTFDIEFDKDLFSIGSLRRQ